MDLLNHKSSGFLVNESTEVYANGIMSAKTISDPVHGHMAIHPLCIAIIDTPQFQRLRFIRQCGFLDYVYPGAIHNRFSHSIGVSYLAGRFIRTLRDHQPNLRISETDILCVEIAGLCHDLGHGPFSHTWEKYMKKQNSSGDHQHWKHEIVSVNMLKYLIKANNLGEIFNKWSIGKNEISTINNMILGRKEEDQEKHFLYQIINNDDSGLDVDKWDYYLRDSYYLGLPCRFDYERLILLARVIPVKGTLQICFRDKEINNVFEMFRIRSELHRAAYQHRFGKLIESLFLEILMQIDGMTLTPKGEVYRFQEWSNAASLEIKDEPWESFSKRLACFAQLTDNSILSAIQYCPKGSSLLPSVQQQLDLFHDRPAFKKAYCVIGEAQITNGIISEEMVSTHLLDFMPKAIALLPEGPTGAPLKHENLLVQLVDIHWGKGKINPLNAVYFYSKRNPNVAQCLLRQCQNEIVCPNSFQQVKLRVFGRHVDDFQFEVLRRCFELYCEHCSYLYV